MGSTMKLGQQTNDATSLLVIHSTCWPHQNHSHSHPASRETTWQVCLDGKRIDGTPHPQVLHYHLWWIGQCAITQPQCGSGTFPRWVRAGSHSHVPWCKVAVLSSSRAASPHLPAHQFYDSKSGMVNISLRNWSLLQDDIDVKPTPKNVLLESICKDSKDLLHRGSFDTENGVYHLCKVLFWNSIPHPE